MWTFVELAEIAHPEEGQSYPNLLFAHGQIPEEAPDQDFIGEDMDDDFDEDLIWIQKITTISTLTKTGIKNQPALLAVPWSIYSMPTWVPAFHSHRVGKQSRTKDSFFWKNNQIGWWTQILKEFFWDRFVKRKKTTISLTMKPIWNFTHFFGLVSEILNTPNPSIPSAKNDLTFIRTINHPYIKKWGSVCAYLENFR